MASKHSEMDRRKVAAESTGHPRQTNKKRQDSFSRGVLKHKNTEREIERKGNRKKRSGSEISAFKPFC